MHASRRKHPNQAATGAMSSPAGHKTSSVKAMGRANSVPSCSASPRKKLVRGRVWTLQSQSFRCLTTSPRWPWLCALRLFLPTDM